MIPDSPREWVADHARSRAAERYGIHATIDEWRRAVMDIMDAVSGAAARATLLARLPAERERWLVRLGTRAIVVVYLPRAALIVTAIPHHAGNRPNWKGRLQMAPGRERRERPWRYQRELADAE